VIDSKPLAPTLAELVLINPSQCADSLKFYGVCVPITEVNPINALQAAMAGYKGTTMEDATPCSNIFVTTTGNRDIIISKLWKVWW